MTNVKINWLNDVAVGHSNSEETKKLYIRGLDNFCTFAGTTSEQIVKQYEDADAEGERKLRHKFALLIEDYASDLVSKGYSSGTVKNYSVAVKSFFNHRDLALNRVSTIRVRSSFHNRDITKEEVLAVLNASNVRERAYYAVLAQTGLRPMTLSLLRLSDLQPDWKNGTVPCKVQVREEITKGKYKEYFTFMPEESIKYLKEYFLTRPNMTDDSYLFVNYGQEDKATNPKTLSALFGRKLVKLKSKGVIDFEKREGRKPSQLRLYTLRKFFRRCAGNAGFDYVNYWLGHSLGIDNHYFSIDPENHRKVFVEKAMPNLRLASSTPNESEKTIQALRTQIEEDKLKFDDLESRFKRMYSELTDVMKYITQLQSEKDEKNKRESAQSSNR